MFYLQNPGAKKPFQVYLKSNMGPIYVMLVNKDSVCSSPVAVEPLPPKSDLDGSTKVCKQAVLIPNVSSSSVFF